MLPSSKPSVFAASMALVACTAGGCATLVGADFDNLHYYLAPDAGPPLDAAPVDALFPVDASHGMDARPDAPMRDAGQDAIADANLPDTNDAAPATRRAFVTSTVYAANLGGLTGADAKCQLAADNAGLFGTFRAWLSSDTESANARLTHASVPYALVTGTIVASSWTQLVSGTLAHAIDRTELGGAPPTGTTCSGASVWSGTDISGTHYTGYNCSAWTTSVSGSADVGQATLGTSSWTAYCTGVCTGTAALYCFEQ